MPSTDTNLNKLIDSLNFALQRIGDYLTSAVSFTFTLGCCGAVSDGSTGDLFHKKCLRGVYGSGLGLTPDEDSPRVFCRAIYEKIHLIKQNLHVFNEIGFGHS